jgi:hypothetical protein
LLNRLDRSIGERLDFKITGPLLAAGSEIS